MLRLAFAGAGAVVCDRHLPALAHVGSVRVVGVADVDTDRARAAAAQAGGVPVFESVEELLDAGGVDALAVCVPPRAHAHVATAAARRGVHLFVEKPLAVPLADARATVAAAHESGVGGVTGFNLRCHRHVRAARTLLAAGETGELVAVRTTFTDPLLDDGRLPDWRRSREHGGGALWDKAVHHVDLWRHLLGDEIAELAATTRSDPEADDSVALLTGRTHAGVLLEAIAADHGPVRQEIQLIGRRATLELDLYRSDGLRLVPPGELPGAVGTRLRGALHTARSLSRLARDARVGGVFRQAYTELWRSFGDAVRGREGTLATLEDGLRAVECLDAALAGSQLAGACT